MIDVTSGIYGIISESTNGIINNSVFNFGNAALLTLDGSNISLDKNKYLVKQIQLLHKSTALSATIYTTKIQGAEDSDEYFAVPLQISDFTIPLTLQRINNSLYNFYPQVFTYTYKNIQDNPALPLKLVQHLTGQISAYKLDYQLYISGIFPEVDFLKPENIQLQVVTNFFGRLFNSDNTEETYTFDSILNPVSGSIPALSTVQLSKQIPASGNIKNLTEQGLSNFPASGIAPVSGTFQYIQPAFDTSHIINAFGNALMEGLMLSSSVTGGLISSTEATPTVITALFTCDPTELSTLYPDYKYVPGTSAIVVNDPKFDLQTLTGTLQGTLNITR